jgi:predicted anti-sigma-YlaC factor YlaD
VARLEDLEDHLAGCKACCDWRDQAHRLARLTRLGPVVTAPQPFSAAAVGLVERAPPRPTSRRCTALRCLLAVCGLAILTMVIPLVWAGGTDEVHDFGAVSLALGAGILLCAWQPWRAASVAAIVGIAGLLSVGLEMFDFANGGGSPVDLVRHGLVVVAWLSMVGLNRLQRLEGGGSPGTPVVPIDRSEPSTLQPARAAQHARPEPSADEGISKSAAA